jgi:4,5-DOPA dioxygenase extradiol
MPTAFISHGAPTVAIEHGAYQDSLAAYGTRVRPKAIVALSAHWGSAATVGVGRATQLHSVHDFGGFPPALYELQYAPPGSPELAERVGDSLKHAGWTAEFVNRAGLDHGVWIPLRLMYPDAKIPVVQLSVPLEFKPEQLYQIGRTLAALAEQDVLILGSGGIVHNLRLFRGGEVDLPVEDWAKAFDDWFAEKLQRGQITDLLAYRELAPHAGMAVPTFEHLAPVFVVLGAARDGARVELIFEGFQYGTISLRSFALT